MPKTAAKLPLLLAVAVLGVLAIPAQARASACSKALIHDWYVDARIDKTYPVRCYREALKHIPEDQIVYGTLRDDLTRALQNAVRTHDGKVRPETLIPGKGGDGGGPNGGSSGGGKHGFFYWVSRKLGPGTADSIPIPLLVLGGLALLLLGAAGVSYLARYYQARRAQPAPAPAQPKPRP